MSSMVTIKQIAQETGVTAATVSYVLNGKRRAASADTAEKIKEIAKQLGYRPNALARKLQRGRSNSIGIITEDLTVFNTPHIVDGIEGVCEEHGYEVVIENMRLFKRLGHNFSDIDMQKRLCDESINSLLAKQVEGIVYVANHCREMTFLPHGIGVPIVCVYCYCADGFYPAVLMDDEGAGERITQILLKKGCSKIGAVCGPEDSYHTQKRLSGYRAALQNAGIPADDNTIVYGDWNRQDGYDAASRMIEAGCDGVFAFNDKIAGGIMDWCSGNGIKAGKDLAVFGFDNQEVSTFYSPQISTAALPLAEMGEESAQLLLSLCKGTRITAAAQLLLPCKIYERESTGKIVVSG